MEGTTAIWITVTSDGLTLPSPKHSHEEGCTVVGGYVYRGSRFTSMQGFYIYGDYCNGRSGF